MSDDFMKGVPRCAHCGRYFLPGDSMKNTSVLRVNGRDYHFHAHHAPAACASGHITIINPDLLGLDFDTSKWDKTLDK